MTMGGTAPVGAVPQKMLPLRLKISKNGITQPQLSLGTILESGCEFRITVQRQTGYMESDYHHYKLFTSTYIDR
jgi:hypothetical protein